MKSIHNERVLKQHNLLLHFFSLFGFSCKLILKTFYLAEKHLYQNLSSSYSTVILFKIKQINKAKQTTGAEKYLLSREL